MRCAFVGAVVGVLGLAGCSSSGTPSTSTSSASSTATSGSSSKSGSSASSSSAKAGSSTSASYPPGKEQICQARDQLQQSITALANPSLLLGGSTAIKAAVDQVQTDLNAVAAAGKQDYQPQITAVQTSLQQLETAVGNLGNGNAAPDLKAVGTAIAATGTAAGDLFTQLTTACGS